MRSCRTRVAPTCVASFDLEGECPRVRVQHRENTLVAGEPCCWFKNLLRQRETLSRSFHGTSHRQIWQEYCQKTNCRQIRTDVIDECEACHVGKLAEGCRADRADAEAEAEENAGDHADAA